MQTLKAKISKYMCIITAIVVAVTVFFTFIIDIFTAQKQARSNADTMMLQMEQLVLENQKDLDAVKEEYRQACLNNAKTISYMVRQNPEIMTDTDELYKLAGYVQVDEIHFFNKDGYIFAGTHPECYGLSMDSGKQISFFKPLLLDKSLALCQDVTPNTAEEKPMQYSALWDESGQYIIQIGMNPTSIMKVTEKNELSYIFSLLRVNTDANLYAISISDGGNIIASTDTGSVGKYHADIGFPTSDLIKKPESFHATINGVPSYCVFKKIDNTYIGRVSSNALVYKDILSNTLERAICLILIGLFQIYVIVHYMNRFVVQGIHDINDKLNLIMHGNLKERVATNNTTEFAELSNHINDMVKSLMDNNRKMSYVLRKTNMYIGVYEYNRYMKQIRFTEYIPQILAIDLAQMNELASSYLCFREFIDNILKHPVEGEKNVYQLPSAQTRYIRLDEYIENDEIFGVVIDVTDDIEKRKLIESERDADTLTGLYNRRALEQKITFLLNTAKEPSQSAFIMVDADGLKEINDKYGHEKGDIYLKNITKILQSFDPMHSVAGRFGGDEFILFLHGYEHLLEIQSEIDKLEHFQNNSFIYLDDTLCIPVRFSFGISYLSEASDYHTLLKLADDRMYQNKKARKKQ